MFIIGYYYDQSCTLVTPTGERAGCSPSSCFTTSISRHEVRCKVETLHVTTQHNIAFSRLSANSDFHTPLTPCSMKQFKYSFLFISTKKHKRSRSQRPGVNHLLKSKWYFSLQYSLILIYWYSTESICPCQFQHLCQVACPVHWKYHPMLTGVRVVVSLFNGSSAVGEYNGIYIHD